MPITEEQRREAERVHDQMTAFTDTNNAAAYKSGEVAIRTVLLINGAAVIALLAFIGNLAKDKLSPARLEPISYSMLYFALGVVLGCVALAAAYFTNLNDANYASSQLRTWTHPYLQPGLLTARYERYRYIFHVAAVVFAVLCLALFVIGVVSVRAAIPSLATDP